MSVRILGFRPRNVCFLASIARITVSKKSFDEASVMDYNECTKWILELIVRGHTSVLEHAVYTFEVVCSRVCSHQLVRHRIASYTQQSMRHTEGFLRKCVLELAHTLGLPAPEKPRGEEDYRLYARIAREAREHISDMLNEILHAVEIAFVIPPTVVRKQDDLVQYILSILESLENYYELLARKIPLEDARYILPSAVKTRIIFSMNARELFEVFLPLRMCSRAQWEIRTLAWKIWDILNNIHPEMFGYAGPRCVLLDLRARARPCKLQDYLEGRCTPIIERCPEKTPRQAIPACIKHAYAMSYSTTASYQTPSQ